MERPYDLVVLGATGFTGGKTAEYLARNAPDGLRWAIAGRSNEKLDAVKARLVKIDSRCRDIGALHASVDDGGSLSRIAAQTRVLLTTVGPFVDYGEPVVRACIDERTDYVDSTGEPHFVQKLIDEYSPRAIGRNVRLVPSCGFDSVPADLGALFTVNRVPKGVPVRLSAFVSMRGTFSGGTERSVLKTLEMYQKSKPREVPPAPPERRLGLLKPRIRRRTDLGGWVAPFPTIDASVVLRSAASLDGYGPDFSYGHYAVHKTLPELLGALWVFGSLKFFARFAPVRSVLLKLIKKSGEGPPEDEMEKNWFKIRFIAECGDQITQTEVAGGDPATKETAKMLAESALCLARDREALPDASGVLTPAQAMGDVLLNRLQHKGLQFSVV